MATIGREGFVPAFGGRVGAYSIGPPIGWPVTKASYSEPNEIQRENPACELMIVCKSPADDDVVYLTEVWSSESEWEEARSNPVIAEWAKDMPSLVAEAPQSVRLDPVGGKVIS